MRTNIVIDDALMRQAMQASGARSKREAVELGLRTLVRLQQQGEIRAFQKKLLDAGVLTMVRRTRGDDIDAACGQLKGQVLDRTRRQAAFRKTLEGGTDAAA